VNKTTPGARLRLDGADRGAAALQGCRQILVSQYFVST
jgi:hypothetical protein